MCASERVSTKARENGRNDSLAMTNKQHYHNTKERDNNVKRCVNLSIHNETQFIHGVQFLPVYCFWLNYCEG